MQRIAIPFRKIAPDFLRSIAQGNIHTPSLYYSPNPLAREGFWLRLRMINRMMNRLGAAGGRCLDFGGGGGVFLPTLAARFREVVCIDLDAREARQIAAHFGIANATIDETDIGRADYSAEPFDAVVAADVLEHFRDLAPPVRAIRDWMKPGALLFTSLPTENWAYVLVRRLGGLEKPADHYHDARGVEAYLERSGFVPARRSFLPFGVPLAPLFHITAWRREP
jgi:SAM-dependent methyltransferase